MQNFKKIDALVFEKSCPPTSKIQFWEKTRLKQKATHRDPDGRRFQKTFLEFHPDWLETLGKYSWHVVLLYKKLWKKPIFKTHVTHVKAAIQNKISIIKPTVLESAITTFENRLDKIIEKKGNHFEKYYC